MKLIKIAYYRLYQTGFRLAMPLLPWRKPTVLEGAGSVKKFLSKTHPHLESIGFLQGKNLVYAMAHRFNSHDSILFSQMTDGDLH